MSDEALNSVGRVLVDNAAAEALGMSAEAVRDLTLRQFIERAIDRGLDVDVDMRQSRSRTGGLSVTYRPDRRASSIRGDHHG